MNWIQLARDLNHILTLFALPLAVALSFVFLYVQRRWRRNKKENPYGANENESTHAPPIK